MPLVVGWRYGEPFIKVRKMEYLRYIKFTIHSPYHFTPLFLKHHQSYTPSSVGLGSSSADICPMSGTEAAAALSSASRYGFKFSRTELWPGESLTVLA